MTVSLCFFLMWSPCALLRMLLPLIVFAVAITVDSAPITSLPTTAPSAFQSIVGPTAAHSSHLPSQSTGSANSLAHETDAGSLLSSSSLSFNIKTPEASDSSTSIVVAAVASASVGVAVVAFTCAKKRKEASLATLEERWLGTPRESSNDIPVQDVVIDVHEPVDAVRDDGDLNMTSKTEIRALALEPQGPAKKVVVSNWV